MLCVFYGNDAVGVRTQALECLKERGAGGEVVTLDADTFTLDILEHFLGAMPLFGVAQTLCIDTVSESAEAFAKVAEYAPALAAAANLFVVVEGGLTAAQKKLFAPHAECMVEVTKKADERFNTFALADAFLKRDKKSLWILLTQALAEGVSSEEIIGTLYWQIKILRLASATRSAEEAGQKPFVYDKAKRALSLFREGEIRSLSCSLLAVYHEGHRGVRDIAHGLEAWVLSL